MATLKQTQTITGTTDRPNLWTWKQVVYEYWDDDYITNNRSRIVVESYLGRASGQNSESFGGTAPLAITCNGENRTTSKNWNYGHTYLSGGEWFLMYSETFYVEHTSDGTKTISISSTMSGAGFSPYNASASGSVALTTIPRATPAVNVDCGVEDSATFTLTPYSTSFSNSVSLTFAGTTQYLKQDGTYSSSEVKYAATGTNKWKFAPDTSWYARFTGYSETGTVTVKTYSGSTLIGTKTGTLIVGATSAHCTPEITGSVVDTNDKTINLTGSANNVVKYMSTLKASVDIQISSSGDNNATLTSLQYNGTNAGSVSDRTFTISKPTSKSVSIYAKNSRTHSKTQSISASGSLIEYILPTLTITSAKRTEPTTGDAKIEFKGDYFNGNFSSSNANSLTVTWKYKQKSSSDYTLGGTITPTLKDNTYSGTINVDGLFDYKSQYDIIIVVEDKLNTVSATASIPRSFPIFWWSENFVDVLGELRVNGTNIVKKYDDSISSINSNITTINNQLSNSKISIATLYTNSTQDFTNSDRDIINFEKYDITDYTYLDLSLSYNRIVIQNSKIIHITLGICGSSAATPQILITDSDGNIVFLINYLIQPSGNTYWSQTFSTNYIILDPTKTYYVYAKVGPYNTTQFNLNSGFGTEATRLSVARFA